MVRRGRRKLVKVLLTAVGSLAMLGLLTCIGLRVRPGPLPPVGLTAAPLEPVPLEDGLPEPVERFYRALYGETVPVIRSAVISAEAPCESTGSPCGGGCGFAHATGRSYRHHIKATIYGARVLTVHETYLDGAARLELPFGTSEGPNIDQGANLALWAEAIWMPSVWLTDERVRWEPIDSGSAFLIVPFGAVEETFAARFDRVTGLLRQLESLRFKGADDKAKTIWRNDVTKWADLDGRLMAIETELTWVDDGSPWAKLTTEEVVYNAEVDDYLLSRGP